MKTIDDIEMPICEDICPEECEGARKFKKDLRNLLVERCKELLREKAEYEGIKQSELSYGALMGRIKELIRLGKLKEKDLK